MQGTVLISQNCTKYKNLVSGIAILILMAGIWGILLYQPFFMRRGQALEALNKMCIQQDPNQSKWYTLDDSVNTIAICGSSSYIESVCFSEFQKLPLTIQLVRGDRSIKKILDTISADRYYRDRDSCSYSIKGDLNPEYFHIKEGPYKELFIDSAKLDVIRRIYR